jgi:hypothetical protein
MTARLRCSENPGACSIGETDTVIVYAIIDDDRKAATAPDADAFELVDQR